MATLALGAAGAALGSALLPGISLFGATLTGAAIGQAAGAFAGSYIDNALFGASGQSRLVEGPRLSDLQVMTSSEGAPIPRLYGRMRLAGQVIWATNLAEEIVRSREGAGGGKASGGSSSGTTERVDYRYFANFAVGLCEGEITRIGRIWADGKEMDLSDVTYRVHRGDNLQMPDSLIEAKEGAGLAPAYRGLAYVVFEHLALERYGNRIPQLAFEVFRAVDRFEDGIRAVTVIPASGEFAYETVPVTRDMGGGNATPENVHTTGGRADWHHGIDQLEDSLANVRNVSLVVSWFGNDLRAGECRLRPGVETRDKVTQPYAWTVAGVGRGDAHLVSELDGRPTYGGTPSDRSVIAAIRDLAARGIDVTFYPFVLMDVPAGNGLPDPYGASEQAVFPWRGRITVHPAAGQAASVDKTVAAAAQVAAFVGTADIGDFSISGDAVVYSGPAEWSLRRMVLHYAHLCQAAGGVDAFLIGSELRGLTSVRSAASTYPFVAALVQLAADVRQVLGSQTKISYAADWSEYFGHQPADGSGDVHFHLDPLWASPDIDAIGIDVYWPLSDWRDGEGHLDRVAGAATPYALDYLKSNIFGGEGYDWYYASAADRENQVRTPIGDGAGKPWVFRYKDIRNWWQNQHFNRPGGIEGASPTAWVPASKPIWFTETGCPAVDKGANQPNVFYDPKSSESHLPYFSRGIRDDLIQRRYIQALTEFFDPAHADYLAGTNPASAVYGGTMLETGRIYIYTWDARPYPAFPYALDIWADGSNWQFGHWLTGRLGGGSLAAVVAAILDDHGFTAYSPAGLSGIVEGYVIDRPMSARQALQPLELAYFFDSVESGGSLRFTHRSDTAAGVSVGPDDLVESGGGGGLYELTRAQETELPGAVKLTYTDGSASYGRAAVEARRTTGFSTRASGADLAIVMDQRQARQIAETWLRESWVSRNSAAFVLPPSRLALEPADRIVLETPGQHYHLRITAQSDGLARQVEALASDPDLFVPLRTPTRQPRIEPVAYFGPPIGLFLDLPDFSGAAGGYGNYVAAYQNPWPGGVAFHKSGEATGYVLAAIAAAPATIGETLSDLAPGPESRLDYGNRLEVKLSAGSLASVSETALLGGANLAAIEAGDGLWEVLQFRDAVLTGSDTYRLSVLLRGQGGTEDAQQTPITAGARFVLLDGAVTPAGLSLDETGLAYNWQFGPQNRAIGSASYSGGVHAFSARGLRPLSPVHVRAKRVAGDLEIKWTRRSRISGDGWETNNPPVGEESEAYLLEILDGANVVRTIAASAPGATYLQSDQIADFGAPQPYYDLRIAQISATVGPGTPRYARV